jgi:hypothetical protein
MTGLTAWWWKSGGRACVQWASLSKERCPEQPLTPVSPVSLRFTTPGPRARPPVPCAHCSRPLALSPRPHARVGDDSSTGPATSDCSQPPIRRDDASPSRCLPLPAPILPCLPATKSTGKQPRHVCHCAIQRRRPPRLITRHAPAPRRLRAQELLQQVSPVWRSFRGSRERNPVIPRYHPADVCVSFCRMHTPRPRTLSPLFRPARVGQGWTVDCNLGQRRRG